MSWKWSPHHNINKEQWDKTVLTATNGSVYAFSWYLDIISPDWEALIYKDYEAVLPLPVKNFLGRKIVQQPLFAQQLGIFSKNIELLSNPNQLFELLQATFPYLTLNFNKYNLFTQDWLTKYNIRTQKKTNYELDLIPAYDYLWKNFSTNNKRNILKARKEGFILKINSIKPETFTNFVRINLHEKVGVLKTQDYKKINDIVSFALQAKIANIYSVHSSNQSLLSTVAFLYSHRKAYFLFAASNSEGKQRRAMFFLIDEFLKKHAEQNLVLDFEGSMIPGLARFYSGFGALPTNYCSLTYNQLPFYLRWIKQT